MTRNVLSLHTTVEYDDDFGAVIWWHLPVCEPPEIGHGPGSDECHADGTPTACARLIESGWLTHWSFLPDPGLMTTTDGATIHA